MNTDMDSLSLKLKQVNINDLYSYLLKYCDEISVTTIFNFIKDYKCVLREDYIKNFLNPYIDYALILENPNISKKICLNKISLFLFFTDLNKTSILSFFKIEKKTSKKDKTLNEIDSIYILDEFVLIFIRDENFNVGYKKGSRDNFIII